MRLYLTFSAMLVTSAIFAQVSGSIFDPAVPAINPMDPNGDGYVTSTNVAFTGPSDETQFELPFIPLQQYEHEPAIDGGSGCKFYDLVNDAQRNAESAYSYFKDPDGIPENGDELLILRLRLASFSTTTCTFSILIDTDYRFGFSGPEADPNAVIGNPGFEKAVSVVTSTGTSGGVRVFTVDGLAAQGAMAFYGPLTSHYQLSYAYNNDPACTEKPIFADLYFPFSALGISYSTQIRIAVATNNSVGTTLGGNARDISGVNGLTIPDTDTQFMLAINYFSPIHIGDPNNQSPLAADAVVSLTENTQTGTTVHTVSANDPNGDALTYTITAGNTNNAFAIDGSNGLITVLDGGALDFELVTCFDLVVSVSDGKLYDNAIITVNLADINEFTPVAEDATLSLDENSLQGTVAHTVVADDGDGSAVLTYSITAGNTGDAFSLNSTTGAITVNGDNALDFESTSTYTIAIHVSDGLFSDDATITISISDVNEAPVVQGAFIFVERRLKNGELVHTVQAIDPDRDDVLSYSIEAGNSEALVSLEPASGEMAVANAKPLFPGPVTISLLVVATDKAGLSGKGTIELVILRLPELTDLNPLKGFSPNGDDNNDFWLIEGIEDFPENKIEVFNRWGISIYETNGYDNAERVWRGEGSSVNIEAESTCFYVIRAGDYEPITGYVIVKP